MFFFLLPAAGMCDRTEQTPLSDRIQSEQSLAYRSGYEEERAATPVCSSTRTVRVRAAYIS